MTTLGLRGRPLRALAEVSGLVGAEITGAMGAALGGVLLAVNSTPTTWAGFILLPALIAGAGPVGYDMAHSWVPNEERLASAAHGSRVAFHAAGVAAALLFTSACAGLALAVTSGPTVVLFVTALLGLPYLAAVGRRLALRMFSGSSAVLPVSVAVILGAAPTLMFLTLLLLGRAMGED